MTFDEKKNLLYVPGGNAAPDIYDEGRPGPNLYTNSLIALDGATGRLAGTDNSFRTTYTITMSRTSAQCSGRRSVGRLGTWSPARARMEYCGFWMAIRLISSTAFRSLAELTLMRL
jgi:hypothetical protein